MSKIDLNAYFERIRFGGDTNVSLDTLKAIHLCHAEAIPFENLTPFLGLPVNLHIDALWTKMVHRNRGGYCFEQNTLLAFVLRRLGFHVSGLAARVLWHASDPKGVPATHMLLKVRLGGENWIVDAGFGGQVLTGPLRLVPDVAQSTPHEMFRLRPDGGGYILQSLIRDTWEALYSFDLSERVAADFQILNHYLSTAANSPFVTGLMVARPGPGRRHAMSSGVFRRKQFTGKSTDRGIATMAEHNLSGQTKRRVITSVPDLLQTLESVFDIVPEDETRVFARLAPKETRHAG